MDISQLESPVLFVVKYAIVAFLVVYLVFTLIVVKQVRVMNHTLDVGFEKVLVLASYVNLSFCVFVLFMALYLL